MHASWPSVGAYDNIVIQSSNYLMYCAHDFRKRKQQYTVVGKSKVIMNKPI